MYFAYILQCADGLLYHGYTSDIEARVLRHKEGRVSATKGRLPVQLIFYEAFLSKQDALRREAYFKTTAGKRAIKLMLRVHFESRQ